MPSQIIRTVGLVQNLCPVAILHSLPIGVESWLRNGYESCCLQPGSECFMPLIKPAVFGPDAALRF